MTHNSIKIRGARQNNLKGLDLDLPLGAITVVTGPHGSGKSSLAFDTVYAEGQRRYVETFSPYARQFLDRQDRPRVERIEGASPTIAIRVALRGKDAAELVFIFTDTAHANGAILLSRRSTSPASAIADLLIA